MRDVNNEAERNIAETRAELAEEARLLDRVVAQALDAAGAGDAAIAIRADALEGTEPALRRLALRTLAERAAGHEVAPAAGGQARSGASRDSPRAARWTWAAASARCASRV